MKKYKITGWVYGNYWGGGQGAYRSTTILADSREEGIKKAEEMLADGSLDSGMGYKSLIGAILDIEENEIIEIDGKNFSHKEYEYYFIGNLSDEMEEFLMECVNY